MIAELGKKHIRTNEIIKREKKVIGSAIHIRFYPLVIDRAEGAIIIDVDGNEYIDFNAGAAVANTGYCHPAVVNAIRDQIEKLTHHCFTLYSNEITIKLAEKLIEITPGKFKKKVWFGLSGSDANECVFKLVPYYTRRPRIISFLGAYHGQTMGSLSLSAHPSMSTFVGYPTVVKVPYPYCYRCPFHLEYPACGLYCIDFIERQIFKIVCLPKDVSCVLVEPIQSDGGDIVPPDQFLPEIKKLCEKHNILLAVDEVKTGFGRTGKMFAVEHVNVEPDIIVLAKPIASGMPLSAVVARDEILDSMVASHLLTTGGHPVACAASLATIEVIKNERLVENAEIMGKFIIKRLKEMMSTHEIIGDVRGRGLIVGLELVKDRSTKEPASLETAKVCYRAWELGLITIYVGIYSNVIEITPPLIITREQCERGLDLLENAIKDVEMGRVSDEKIKEYKGW